MPRPLRKLIDHYRWVHTAIGLAGHLCFISGTIAFILGAKSVGNWLFLSGTSGMFIGSLGSAIVMEEQRRERRTGGRTGDR